MGPSAQMPLKLSTGAPNSASLPTIPEREEISPYHETHEGDLIWQIGTGYFGCRREDGSFCAKVLKTKQEKTTSK